VPEVRGGAGCRDDPCRLAARDDRTRIAGGSGPDVRGAGLPGEDGCVDAELPFEDAKVGWRDVAEAHMDDVVGDENRRIDGTPDASAAYASLDGEATAKQLECIARGPPVGS